MKKFSSKILLWYLRKAVKLQLAKSKPVIIGIGGSAGKTSLCRILKNILKEKFRVKASEGLNTETGIPLSILKIPPRDYSFFDWIRIIILVPIRLLFNWEKYDYCIAEMAIDKPNDMRYLLKIIKPKIATLTNIALEHSEYFDSFVKNKKNHKKEVMKLIEKEEGMLIKTLPANGVAVLNIDDERIARLKSKTKAKIIAVSIKNEKADFYVKNSKLDLKSLRLEILFRPKGKSALAQNYSLTIKRPLSNAYIYTILLAIALASACGVKIKDAIKIIEKKFTLPGSRLSIFEGIKETIIIDSSYNAQPISMIDALDFLKRISENKRKVAVLGDMRELGKEAKKEHEIVAEKIKETVDFPILIGPLMKRYVVPFLENAGKNYKWFENFTKAKEFIIKKIKRGDFILVKGSQNTLLLERVVEMILKEKKDKKNLCRQRPYWERKRKETP